MNVSLIEMPATVAAEQLKTYRRSLHRRADAEYEQIAVGLAALAKGTSLLQLSRVFSEVPRDERGRPRLAIARADRLRVKYESSRGNGWSDNFDCAYDQRLGARPHNSIIEVPVSSSTPTRHVYGYALVPIVPPTVHFTGPLKEHFILWEVERWAESAREVGPDIDPCLLRRVSVDLFAVVAEWDLTPLEQAILAGRRTMR